MKENIMTRKKRKERSSKRKSRKTKRTTNKTLTRSPRNPKTPTLKMMSIEDTGERCRIAASAWPLIFIIINKHT